MTAIYKRELNSYFTSMIGCIFTAFLVAYTGIYFMVYNLSYGYPYFSYVLVSLVYILLVAVPILTMKCFAEDRKNKTDQMLFTAPVSTTKIVLGKYLAMLTVLAVPCFIFCLFPLIIKTQGTAYFKVDYASIFTFFLLGCVFAAIGMLVSAMTESLIIAAIGTFGVLLFLYLLDNLVQFLPSSVGGGMVGIMILVTLIILFVYHMTRNPVLCAVLEIMGFIICLAIYFVKKSILETVLSTIFEKFVLTTTLQNVAVNQMLDVPGLVFYLTLIIMLVFLTVQVLQKRRWS